MNSRGARLERLDRPQEALAAYQQLIDGYRDDPSPAYAARSSRRSSAGVGTRGAGPPAGGAGRLPAGIDGYRDDPSPAVRSGRQGADQAGPRHLSGWTARRRRWPPSSN